MTFREYIDALYYGIPSYAYEMLGSIAALGIVVFLAWKGKAAGKFIAALLSIEYIALIFFSTVLFRLEKAERIFNSQPLRSYFSTNNYGETYMNVLAFIPLGLLLGWAFYKHSFVKTIMVGFMVSVTVESLQFCFKRGFSEINDVINNTLGCAIGFGVYRLLSYECNKMEGKFILKRANVPD